MLVRRVRARGARRGDHAGAARAGHRHRRRTRLRRAGAGALRHRWASPPGRKRALRAQLHGRRSGSIEAAWRPMCAAVKDGSFPASRARFSRRPSTAASAALARSARRIACKSSHRRRAARAARAAAAASPSCPTMGNLHDGHLSLMRDRAPARRRASSPASSSTACSSGRNEDFDRYPRTLEADCASLRARRRATSCSRRTSRRCIRRRRSTACSRRRSPTSSKARSAPGSSTACARWC